MAHPVLARRSHRIPLRPLRPPVFVKGTQVDDDTYRDDFGNTWTYEVTGGIGSLERAVTSAYGGGKTGWRYLRAQVNADIDRQADLLHSVEKAASDAGKAAEESKSDTTPEPKPKSPIASPTIRKAIATFAPPAAPGKKVSPWAYVAAVSAPVAGWFIRGPVGLGAGLLIGVGAWVLGKRAAA